MNIVDILVAIQIIVTFPIGVYIFGGRTKVTLEGIWNMCGKYRYHLLVIIGIHFMKVFIDMIEPSMEIYATDYTMMIYGFEGNSIYWVQNYLISFPMTFFMSVIYIGSFLFIMVFSLVLFCYLDERRPAAKLAFLYIVLFFLTIPFYLFVIVYVPSYPKMLYPGAESIITGMKPLLYNFGPNVNEFFVGYETFNNCFPSMHIGYPAAILMSLHINARGFRGYKYFLLVFLILIGISIVYLGIHWLLDIVAGVLIALVGVIIAERYAHRFWKRIHRFDRRLKQRFKWW